MEGAVAAALGKDRGGPRGGGSEVAGEGRSREGRGGEGRPGSLLLPQRGAGLGVRGTGRAAARPRARGPPPGRQPRPPHLLEQQPQRALRVAGVLSEAVRALAREERDRARRAPRALAGQRTDECGFAGARRAVKQDAPGARRWGAGGGGRAWEPGCAGKA
jgi:hypothetical protein